eukprot:GHUV01047790.1.p1 GENE.GHUV01047790.1~~GHUV01047790.1.p1  ORF type:complete len:121 (-),score=13.78 GHUV01047790.1:121-483(-)
MSMYAGACHKMLSGTTVGPYSRLLPVTVLSSLPVSGMSLNMLSLQASTPAEYTIARTAMIIPQPAADETCSTGFVTSQAPLPSQWQVHYQGTCRIPFRSAGTNLVTQHFPSAHVGNHCHE